MKAKLYRALGVAQAIGLLKNIIVELRRNGRKSIELNKLDKILNIIIEYAFYELGELLRKKCSLTNS